MYASSKKQNMVCLSSGESELMALVGGACEGIATRDQWSKLCKCSPKTIVLCTDSSAALGFVKRKGASRRTRHVDTKVHFIQAWAKKPGQRIFKVHGDSQQVAACLTKLSNFDRCSNLSNIDEEVRKIAAHKITASDLNTFTNTLLINMRMKFVTTTTSKSDDELTSLKETFGLCERNVRTWLVNSALESVESRMNCADNNHVTGLWDISYLTLRGIEWIHVW